MEMPFNYDSMADNDSENDSKSENMDDVHHCQSTATHCLSNMNQDQSPIEPPNSKNATDQLNLRSEYLGSANQSNCEQPLPNNGDHVIGFRSSVIVIKPKINGNIIANVDLASSETDIEMHPDIIDLLSDDEMCESQIEINVSKDDENVAYKSQTMPQQQKTTNINEKAIGNLKRKHKLNDAMDKVKRFKSDEPPYECEFCKKQFTRKWTLDLHMKIHKDMFAFQCSLCRCGFSDQILWKLHENKCKIKQYACYLCKRIFYSQKSNLEWHIRSMHSGDKPIGCIDCSKKFYVKTQLTQHLRLKHNKVN